jgi:hypothetical protein
MSNIFSTLGRIMIFAGILPGIVGTSVYLFLNESLYNMPVEVFFIQSLLFGFVANSIGHFFDEILKILCKDKKSNFVKIILLKSAKLIDENTENKLMEKIEYLESLRAFYLNSSVIVILIIIYFVCTNHFNLCKQQGLGVAILLVSIILIVFLIIRIHFHIKNTLKELGWI